MQKINISEVDGGSRRHALAVDISGPSVPLAREVQSDRCGCEGRRCGGEQCGL